MYPPPGTATIDDVIVLATDADGQTRLFGETVRAPDAVSVTVREN